MLILAILVLGLAAGWAAHLLVGRGEPNWSQLFLVGIAGSFVGGLIGSLIFGDGLALRPSGLIGSVLGATLVLLVVRAVSGETSPLGRSWKGTRSQRLSRLGERVSLVAVGLAWRERPLLKRGAPTVRGKPEHP